MKKRFGTIADTIRGSYASVGFTIRPRPPISVRQMVASLTAAGIGDVVMLSDLPKASIEYSKPLVHVWSGSPAFVPVFNFSPWYHPTEGCGVANPFLVDVLRLRDIYDLGNGHMFQQLRRAWGLPIDIKPCGALECAGSRDASKVLLHFEPAPGSVERQRKCIHPRMREVYSSSRKAIEGFIRSRPDLTFIEVGKNPLRLRGSTYVHTKSIEELVTTIAGCGWFLGIMSGPLNIATALNLKCIVIINYPPVEQVVLPTLKWRGYQEEEWLYPQNVHLHQDGGTMLVPKITTRSLQAAFDGDVYPFWEDKWLGLITE